MPGIEHGRKAQRLIAIKAMLLAQPGRRWTTHVIAEICGTSPDTATRDLEELSGRGDHLRLIRHGTTAGVTWEVDPTSFASLPPVELDFSQGAALYAAARLLSQQYDERNDAVRTAIMRVIDVFPPELHPHLAAIARRLCERPGDPDRSQIFNVLTQGWLGQRCVRLTYVPLKSKTPFTCTFAPYILEPSAIGRTLYFLGYSDHPGALRTYKFERMRHAELTEEPFNIPSDFDAAALFGRAWGVMYGDEDPVTVRLRFSHHVSKRVRETRWHASEITTPTDDGLIWEAIIGDITEIKPWIRGWGSDCEVLAPAELRQEIAQDVQRSMRAYGLSAQTPSGDGPDPTLIDDLFS